MVNQSQVVQDGADPQQSTPAMPAEEQTSILQQSIVGQLDPEIKSILQKVDDNIFRGSQRAYEIFKKLDLDQDGTALHARTFKHTVARTHLQAHCRTHGRIQPHARTFKQTATRTCGAAELPGALVGLVGVGPAAALLTSPALSLTVGYINHNDLMRSMREKHIMGNDEIVKLISYLDPDQVGYLGFQEFSSKIRNGCTDNDAQGYQITVPTIYPSKELTLAH